MLLEHNQISDITPLQNITSLAYLWLGENQISDISLLSTFNSLTELYLEGNHISDIYPLVQNEGLGQGDMVNLRANPLSHVSLYDYIPQLKARGVTVFYDIPPNLPPVADAGFDETVAQTSREGAEVTLDGSASYDPDGDPLTYTWTWDNNTATGISPTIFLPLGTTTVSLVVNDGVMDSNTDTVTITVNPINRLVDLFMHGNAPGLTLDETAPSSTTAKYKDSPGINRTTFKEIGTWNKKMEETQYLVSLENFTTWVGLKNSDDQGTYFDIRAEILKNGRIIASGEIRDIRGVTRNPDKAKMIMVTFGDIPETIFEAGEVFSIRILTKVADSGGHNNAVGLRLYYDSTSRPSGLETLFHD